MTIEAQEEDQKIHNAIQELKRMEPPTSTLTELRMINDSRGFYFNTLCRVVSVMKKNWLEGIPVAYLRVCDGTCKMIRSTKPMHKLEADQVDQEGSKIDGELEIVLYPCMVDISCYDEYAQKAMELEPGDVVKINNLRATPKDAVVMINLHGDGTSGKRFNRGIFMVKKGNWLQDKANRASLTMIKKSPEAMSMKKSPVETPQGSYSSPQPTTTEATTGIDNHRNGDTSRTSLDNFEARKRTSFDEADTSIQGRHLQESSMHGEEMSISMTSVAEEDVNAQQQIRSTIEDLKRVEGPTSRLTDFRTCIHSKCSPRGFYFDVMCRVVSVMKRIWVGEVNVTYLRVCDGTCKFIQSDKPLHKLEAGQIDEEGSKLDVELEINLRPCMVDISCFDEYATKAMELEPGDVVKINNLRAHPKDAVVMINLHGDGLNGGKFNRGIFMVKKGKWLQEKANSASTSPDQVVSRIPDDEDLRREALT